MFCRKSIQVFVYFTKPFLYFIILLFKISICHRRCDFTYFGLRHIKFNLKIRIISTNVPRVLIKRAIITRFGLEILPIHYLRYLWILGYHWSIVWCILGLNNHLGWVERIKAAWGCIWFYKWMLLLLKVLPYSCFLHLLGDLLPKCFMIIYHQIDILVPFTLQRLIF